VIGAVRKVIVSVTPNANTPRVPLLLDSTKYVLIICGSVFIRAFRIVVAIYPASQHWNVRLMTRLISVVSSRAVSTYTHKRVWYSLQQHFRSVCEVLTEPQLQSYSRTV